MVNDLLPSGERRQQRRRAGDFRVLDGDRKIRVTKFDVYVKVDRE
jgi:hypothetical protein